MKLDILTASRKGIFKQTNIGKRVGCTPGIQAVQRLRFVFRAEK